jgi:hypothetical protein
MRRALRLASGLVLFTYMAAHLVKHPLDLVSVVAAGLAPAVTPALWQACRERRSRTAPRASISRCTP